MKKPLLMFILVLLAGILHAQTSRFGLKLGLTNAELIEKNNGQRITTGSISNVDLAGYAEFDRGNFSFQPGLAFYLKGAVFNDYFNFNTYELKLYYLEVPLNVQYNFLLGGGKLYVGAGPYLAYALSGTNTTNVATVNTNGTLTQNTNKLDVSFGSGQNDLQRLDYGFNTMAGFRFKNGIDIGLLYGIGLANISNYPNYTQKNLMGSITVGYFFK